MKLIYDLLRQELEDDLGTALLGCNHGCGELDSAIFYRHGMPPEEHLCFVSEFLPDEDMDFSGQNLFILCGSFTEEELEKEKVSTICLSSAWSRIDVLNLLVRVFTRYNRWEDALRSLLHDMGTVKEMLDVSLPIFGNQLLVVDSVFRIVAYAVPERYRSEMEEYGPVIHANEMKQIRGEFPITRQRRGPMLRRLPGLMATLAMNIYDGAFYMGVVCVVESTRPFRPADTFLLEILTNSLRKMFILRDTDQTQDAYSLGYLLSGLISGSRPNPELLDAVAVSSGIAPEDNLFVLAILCPDQAAREYSRYFINKLGHILPVVFIPMEDATVVLIDKPPAYASGDDLNKSICMELSASGLRAGISEGFTGIIRFPLYVQQAIEAARIAVTRKGTILLSFGDCWLEYLLHAAAGSEKRPITMQAEGFCRLVEHDETSRVSYVETLRAYLFNNMNALKAAETLYISRNSFLSRLERIESILNMDLNDPKTRFRLMFSLYSLEV